MDKIPAKYDRKKTPKIVLNSKKAVQFQFQCATDVLINALNFFQNEHLLQH